MSSTTPAVSGQPIETRLDELLSGYEGRFGIAAENLLTGERVERRADEQFDTASVIKLPVMIEALRRVQTGELRLDQRLTMEASHYSEGSGVLKDLQPGVDLSLRDACTLMVIVSDNVATNMLIDLLGIDSVNRTMQAIGAEQTVLLRRISLDWTLGPLGLSTPADCVRLLKGLDRGEILDAERSAVAIDILRRQQANDFLNRYLPFDSNRARLDPEHNLTIASKSGWTRQQRNDVGLIAGPGLRYAVALFAEGYPGLPRHPDHTPVVTLQQVSRAIYDHFGGSA